MKALSDRPDNHSKPAVKTILTKEAKQKQIIVSEYSG